MAKGEPGETSIGTAVTSAGAVLLTVPLAILAYGLVATPASAVT